MKQIKADPLPVISQKWGQESKDEKIFYINPFPKQCSEWIEAQTELFKKYNPINASDIEGKITLYNSRIYFNQPNLTGFGGMPLLISFIEKMSIEEDLEDVFDHEGYIYSTSDILLISHSWNNSGSEQALSSKCYKERCWPNKSFRFRSTPRGD